MVFRLISFLLPLALIIAGSVGSQATATEPPHGKAVLVLNVDGAIGPATGDYILDGLAQAESRQAAMLVIRLDTPGGLDSAMRDIIKGVLSSTVPVAVYVAPSGARAASAGTYMLYASHVAAMAPGTNLGAATPVQMGGGGFPGSPDQPDSTDDQDQPAKNESVSEEPKTAMERKMINDAAAYIRGLAQLRGRNAEWAEEAVRHAASLSAEEALKVNIIDLLAPSLDELVEKSHGRTVTLNEGREHIINTEGATIEQVEMDWRMRFLSIITDPNIAYILMLLGFYGLIYEFLNPGMYLPGVIGAICLILALYALQVLPINYAGLALMLLGIAFMAAEAFMPSFGIVGLGGIIAFTVGSIILLDEEGFRVSLSIIIANAIICAALFTWVLGMMLRLRRQKRMPGQEEMIGVVGIARDDFEHEGYIQLQGELWHAISDIPVRQGQPVRVKAKQGLVLYIEPEQKEF